MTLAEAFRSKLIALAQEETLQDLLDRGDDIVVYDICGGNVDDAFYSGHGDGMTDLAREILDHLGEPWKDED